MTLYIRLVRMTQDVLYACRNPHLERRFQNGWAKGKVAHDKAVLIFFILLLLGIEIADIAFGATPQVGPTDSAVISVCEM